MAAVRNYFPLLLIAFVFLGPISGKIPKNVQGYGGFVESLRNMMKRTAGRFPQKYVVITTTRQDAAFQARDEDYDFAAGVTALNWQQWGGFVPIIVIVSNDLQLIEPTQRLYARLLGNKMDYHILPVLVPKPEVAVTVAQAIRLYASHLLPLPDKSYLRMTDADMMIQRKELFDPPLAHPSSTKFSKNIHIFNAKCCGKHMYPMHSVGMTFGVWRKLFPVPAAPSGGETGAAEIVQYILMRARTGFYHYISNHTTKHGTPEWKFDQKLLRNSLSEQSLLSAGVSVILADGPEKEERIHHPLDPIDYKSGHMDSRYMDIHLYSFKLSQHLQWLDELLERNDFLIGGRIKAYNQYKKEWCEEFQRTCQGL